MARNRFTNPATGASYDWLVNHDDEEATGKTRNFSTSSNTGSVGLVRQQGDDSPYTLKLSGTILHRSQFREFWSWYGLSRGQTIFFTDFDGQSYEVQITDFQPKRVRTARNPRDSSIPYHYWTYTLEMTVYAFRAGDMYDAGVTA